MAGPSPFFTDVLPLIFNLQLCALEHPPPLLHLTRSRLDSFLHARLDFVIVYCVPFYSTVPQSLYATRLFHLSFQGTDRGS